MKGKSLLRGIKHNSPTILTVLAVIGFGATIVTTVRATKESEKRLKEARKEKGWELTPAEKVKTVAPVVAVPAVIGAATVGCMLGANTLNKKQQASLVSAYALLDQSAKTYRKKVQELCGTDVDECVKNSVARDSLKEKEGTDILAPVKKRKHGSGELLLFYDEFSDRFFQRSMEEVQDAEYTLNRNFALRGEATVNEFYKFLDIPEIEGGDAIGWSLYAGDAFYGYSWIDFYHRWIESEEGNFYRIEMPFAPTADYLTIGWE